MTTSIRQKPIPSVPTGLRVAAPEFRNLGVMLRVLLLVNFLGFLTVVVRYDRGDSLGRMWLEFAGMLELPLLVSLAFAWVFAHPIGHLSFPRAVLALTVIAVASVAVCEPWLLVFDDRTSPGRRMLWAAAASVITMGYFHWRASAATPAIAEARMLALNARIRPHFFFNSLNGVLGVLRSDPRRAEAALESLAELFRVLMQENRELVTLGDEIEVVNRYLELERLRLGDRLQVTWDLRHCPMLARVPPLMLQPLVENAVYHGIEPLAEPGEIKVRIGQRGAEVRVEISNPLAGRASHHVGNRMAQANIRERLALFFDIEARMECGPREGRYVVSIRIPLRKESS